MNHQQKTVSICIIGKPNAGKSSLLNCLINQKISIVTPKVQTTRSIITGVITVEDTQIIILDTPGIFEPKKQLEKAMVKCAWSSLYSADIVALIIDSTKALTQIDNVIFERLKSQAITPLFLLNKIDLASSEITHIKSYIMEQFASATILEISVIQRKNIDNLLDHIKQQAKLVPWSFDKDDITNLSYNFLSAEITREQLFLQLHEELPYNLTVHTELWQENADKSVKINQVIVVSRESYKTIILGKNGSMIKEIGTVARKEMEKSFGFKVHLFLFVKVRETWENNPEYYTYMGLKLDKSK